MITIIICALIGFLFVFVPGLKKWKKHQWDFSTFDLLMAVLISVFSSSLIGFGISVFIPTQSYEKESIQHITALSDNNSLSGQFFLGSGMVEGKMVYVMYVNNGTGFTMKQIPSDKAVIKYTTDQPVLKSYELRPYNDYYLSFGTNHNWGNIRYVIQVPKEAIQNSYNLDAQ